MVLICSTGNIQGWIIWVVYIRDSVAASCQWLLSVSFSFRGSWLRLTLAPGSMLPFVAEPGRSHRPHCPLCHSKTNPDHPAAADDPENWKHSENCSHFLEDCHRRGNTAGAAALRVAEMLYQPAHLFTQALNRPGVSAVDAWLVFPS